MEWLLHTCALKGLCTSGLSCAAVTRFQGGPLQALVPSKVSEVPVTGLCCLHAMPQYQLFEWDYG